MNLQLCVSLNLRVSASQTLWGKHVVRHHDSNDASGGDYDDACALPGSLPLLPICALSSASVSRALVL